MRQPLPADMFDELCPSTLNPIRFGDKWAALIIRCLEHGPRRFSELRVPLRRVTPKVLTQSLRSLERGGLVRRTVHVVPISHVEYELTPVGRSMLEPMAVACAWTERHWNELLDARESYDNAARVDRARRHGRLPAHPGRQPAGRQLPCDSREAEEPGTGLRDPGPAGRPDVAIGPADRVRSTPRGSAAAADPGRDAVQRGAVVRRR